MLSRATKWAIDTQDVLLKYDLQFARVLGSFAKLRNATVSSVMCVCPSVRPFDLIRLPLDRFS